MAAASCHTPVKREALMYYSMSLFPRLICGIFLRCYWTGEMAERFIAVAAIPEGLNFSSRNPHCVVHNPL